MQGKGLKHRELKHRNNRVAPPRAALAVAVLALLAACASEPPLQGGHSGRSGSRGIVHASADRAKSAGVPRERWYTVKRGDTMYSIANRNQIDYHDLANWNGVGRDYAIQVGQRLRLSPPPDPLSVFAAPPPGGNGVAAAPASSAPAATPVVVAAPPPPPPPPASSSAAPTTSTPPPQVTVVSGPGAPQPVPGGAPILAPPGSEGQPVSAWQWPVRGPILRPYAPDDGVKGVDIGGTVGSPVVAVAAGKVVYSGSALKGYGELIIIKHNADYLSAYGYNSKRLVEEGDTVQAGQTIAELGTGPENRPELHFEIRYKGKPVDPLSLLPR